MRGAGGVGDRALRVIRRSSARAGARRVEHCLTPGYHSVVTQTVSVREVNQHTSAVLARVRGGEELVITVSGRPQARLIPFAPHDAYERMLAEGRIIPALSPRMVVTEVFHAGLDIDEVLAEERADRDPFA